MEKSTDFSRSFVHAIMTFLFHGALSTAVSTAVLTHSREVSILDAIRPYFSGGAIS